MAPEQARAESADHRADIYAFGLIVYDMLLNRQRARGADTALDELTRRMQVAPPPTRSVDATVPEALDRIVAQCIEPDVARRFQSTPQLVAALARLDDRGKLLPVARRVTRRLVAAVGLAFAIFIGVTWWLARGPAVPVSHEPVSVLIADFQNTTGDAAFDHTIEPILKLALEGASFVSAYDRTGIRRALGVRPPDALDEQAALALAVKQGVNVVLAGTVGRQGSRYTVSVKAIQVVTGKVLTTTSDRTTDKNRVLAVATSLADTVREALGDDTSDSAQRFAMETLSATSLDAVREYARGMEAMSASKFDDALQSFSKAVALDPKFGVAYGAMAATSRNLERQQDAEKYAKEAMSHFDSMTERERYRTRGFYYSITNDYQACVKEYRRPDRALLGRCRGAQQPRIVPHAVAQHAAGGRGDAAGREDSAQPGAVPREPGALCRLQQRLPDRRAGDSRHAEAGALRAAGAGVCAGRAGAGVCRIGDVPRAPGCR